MHPVKPVVLLHDSRYISAQKKNKIQEQLWQGDMQCHGPHVSYAWPKTSPWNNLPLLIQQQLRPFRNTCSGIGCCYVEGRGRKNALTTLLNKEKSLAAVTSWHSCSTNTWRPLKQFSLGVRQNSFQGVALTLLRWTQQETSRRHQVETTFLLERHCLYTLPVPTKKLYRQ